MKPLSKLTILALFVLYLATISGVSAKAQSDVQGEKATNSVRTFAVVIGIADYIYFSQRTGDLNFTVEDARKFYQYLLSNESGRVPAENISLMLNRTATRSAIIRECKRLFLQADANDRIFFFFSGHGSPGCFVPADATKSGDNMLYHDDLKALFRMSSANVKMIFADACFAGSIRTKALTTQSDKNEQIGKGTQKEIAIMLSCADDQVSFEYPGLKQGVFSYYLIRGLQGKADKNSDKQVTMSELYYYLRDNTYTFVKSKLGKVQTPVLFGKFDKNLVISKYRFN